MKDRYPFWGRRLAPVEALALRQLPPEKARAVLDEVGAWPNLDKVVDASDESLEALLKDACDEENWPWASYMARALQRAFPLPDRADDLVALMKRAVVERVWRDMQAWRSEEVP